jgi:hypothetical protein
LKFALVTAHNETYQPLADITWDQNKKLYAQQHGYDAITKTDNWKYGDPKLISFERTELIIELLESGKYDWVHAVGCDTMITNFNIRLEDLVDNDSHFIIAMDCYNINNDSFLARNTPECINWLKHTVSLREKYANHPWYDQQSMIDTIEEIAPYMRIVPQRELNSYDYDEYPGLIPHIYKKDLSGNDGQWQAGDFLIHWPAVPVPRRIMLAQQMLPLVVK